MQNLHQYDPCKHLMPPYSRNGRDLNGRQLRVHDQDRIHLGDDKNIRYCNVRLSFDITFGLQKFRIEVRAP